MNLNGDFSEDLNPELILISWQCRETGAKIRQGSMFPREAKPMSVI